MHTFFGSVGLWNGQEGRHLLESIVFSFLLRRDLEEAGLEWIYRPEHALL